MKGKINKLSRVVVGEVNYNLYKKYEKQFDYFLNVDGFRNSVTDLERYYVPDAEIEAELKSILELPMDSLVAFVGYQGMGKTSDIKKVFKLSNSVARLDSKEKTIFLPIFWQSVIKEEWDYTSIISDFSRRIASVCSMLEEDNEDLALQFYSEQGKEKFYQFIRKLNPDKLEDVASDRKTIEEKVYYFHRMFPLHYYVTKLKFYLLNEKCKYRRLVIILDNIEANKKEEVKKIIIKYVEIFSSLQEFPMSEKKTKRICMNLLMVLRPSTKKRIHLEKILQTRQFSKIITKKKGLDLCKYFENKKEMIPLSILKSEEEDWNTAYSILYSFSNKFEQKYSKMLQNLSYMNIVATLELYKKVLNNMVWIIEKRQNGEYEYVFNNITVIRSIACGNSPVYYNYEENIIPNIFMNANLLEPKGILFGMYLLKYFYLREETRKDYGKCGISENELIKDFVYIFGVEFEEEITAFLKYFRKRGILNYGIYDTKVDNRTLYLSPKGYELWRMLRNDSVLMELYREDFIWEYQEDENEVLSSYELMKDQGEIFLRLLKKLEFLFEVECDWMKQVSSERKYALYLRMFGERMLVEHMLNGIKRSTEYSGKIANPDITNMIMSLELRIQSVQDILEKER